MGDYFHKISSSPFRANYFLPAWYFLLFVLDVLHRLCLYPGGFPINLCSNLVSSYQGFDCLEQIFFDLPEKLLRLVSLTVLNLFIGSIPMGLFRLDFLALFSLDMFFVIKLVVGNMFLVLLSSKCSLLLLMLTSRPDPAEEMPREMWHCSWHIAWAWTSSSRLCCWEEGTGEEENNENFHPSESFWPAKAKEGWQIKNSKMSGIEESSMRDEEIIRYQGAAETK